MRSIPVKKLPPAEQQASLLGLWLFPYVLAGAAYLIGRFLEAGSPLGTLVLVWPVPYDVYGWLLGMVLLASVWLVIEFFTISSRETVILALQWDALVSAITAIIFTALGGWFIGSGTLQWWFVVPWAATLVDALASSWLGINNAAQKPFFSRQS